jgi:hypothetical protein
MRRAERPWFRSQNRAWYACVNGRQLLLARGKKNRKKAVDKLHQFLAGGGSPPPPAETPKTLADLFKHFLAFSEKKHAEGTYENYRYYLGLFEEKHGHMHLAALKQHHVTQWLADKGWSPATEYNAVTCLQRALNFAASESVIAASPLKGYPKPQPQSRARLIEDDELQTILGSIPLSDPFYLLVLALKETGCRPSEAARVTKGEVDLTIPAWVLPPSRSKTKKKRTIYLTEKMPPPRPHSLRRRSGATRRVGTSRQRAPRRSHRPRQDDVQGPVPIARRGITPSLSFPAERSSAACQVSGACRNWKVERGVARTNGRDSSHPGEPAPPPARPAGRGRVDPLHPTVRSAGVRLCAQLLRQTRDEVGRLREEVRRLNRGDEK